MRIQFERTGGFMGLSLGTTVDTESLPVDDAQVLHDAVQSSDFFHLPATVVGTASGADRFHYQLTVEDEAQRHTVEMGESAVPETLEPLIKKLMTIARSAGRS